jgi:hypothetical protein
MCMYIGGPIPQFLPRTISFPVTPLLFPSSCKMMRAPTLVGRLEKECYLSYVTAEHLTDKMNIGTGHSSHSQFAAETCKSQWAAVGTPGRVIRRYVITVSTFITSYFSCCAVLPFVCGLMARWTRPLALTECHNLLKKKHPVLVTYSIQTPNLLRSGSFRAINRRGPLSLVIG